MTKHNETPDRNGGNPERNRFFKAAQHTPRHADAAAVPDNIVPEISSASAETNGVIGDTRSELNELFERIGGRLEFGNLDVNVGLIRVREASIEDAKGIACLYDEIGIKPENFLEIVDPTNKNSFIQKGGIFTILTQGEIETMISNPNCVMVVSTKMDENNLEKITGVCFGYINIDESIPHFEDYSKLKKAVDLKSLKNHKPEFADKFEAALENGSIFMGGDILVTKEEKVSSANLLFAKMGSIIIDKMPDVKFFTFDIYTILSYSKNNQDKVTVMMADIPSQNVLKRLMEADLGYASINIQKGEFSINVRSSIYGSSLELFLKFMRHLEELYLSEKYHKIMARRQGKFPSS